MASSNDITHTLYLFSEDSQGPSLFKLDIALPQQNEQEDGHCCVFTPQVIRRFYEKTRRSQVGCGQLGSKLFILGGIFDYDYTRTLTESPYPLDVMVFDTTVVDPASDAALDMFSVPKMNSPKFYPIMFEVAGKLYVLGSLLDYADYDSPGPNIFEVYDPIANNWKILEPPPVKTDKIVYSWGFSFVLDSTKVVIHGNGTDVYTFNPTTCEWKISDFSYHDTFPFNSLFYLPSHINDYLYWPRGSGQFDKIGPILDPPPSMKVLTIGQDDINYMLRPIDLLSTDFPHFPMMIHLGGGRFCLLESGSFYDEENVDHFGICFNTYICKLNQPDNRVSKCLHSASFRVPTGRYMTCRFTSYHLISKTSSEKLDGPDPKKRKF